ncbi:hypothetical protein M622_05055 [Thauera terpenica 58Eu]|jgi:AcrR family transcriptional regulator|uniref:HTH tetR-type domain-containing protein n=1 Tax=Thauera terpenica 58Eu TaxID=1348657 RepID=S9ZJM6_9RHOO|nr:TetR family transcriptional regulator [Thauera terpenica]EPZ14826.1 hypothetical protein M622_05055 [Thauera terpenica 58Eu]
MISSETTIMPETGKPQTATRRTQEERSAATREKVIQATIDCIVEEGLHNTTAARITARSGITWGAIAHQFGDKDSVLFAVVERNGEIYRKLIDATLMEAGDTPEERIAALIDVTWKYINEPSSFAFNELVIQNRARNNPMIMGQQEDMSFRQMQSTWDKFFGEFEIPQARLETVRNLTLATLQGLSLMRLISQRRPSFKSEIAALKKCALQMLTVEP